MRVTLTESTVSMAVKSSQYHHKNVTIWVMIMMVVIGQVAVGTNTDTNTDTDTVIDTTSSSWCVARSDASTEALQAALDYACYVSAADCTPIQPNGLCYLPNTIQAHASYAFNSYFQRKSMSPGSCDFSATATVAKSDPSYGACVYPSSLSTAGGGITTTPSSTPPTIVGGNALPLSPPSPTFGGGGIIGGGGLSPGTLTSPRDNTSYSSSSSFGFTSVSTILIFITLFLCIN